MKTTKRTILALAAAAIIAPSIQSCKKGEEDPTISLRSRDSRITGTWQMESMEYNKTVTSTGSTSNTVNADTENSSSTTITSITYDGTTENWQQDVDSESKSQEKYMSGFSFSSGYEWRDTSYSTVNDQTDKRVTAKTYKVQIFEDHTYTATITSDLKSTSYRRTFTQNGSSDIDPETTTNYSSAPTTSVTEGTWLWADSKKDKVYISAGPLAGRLVRLSNKEIILEDSDVNNIDDVDVSLPMSFAKYDANNTTSEGTETEKSVVNSKETWTSTWTKVDNEDERAGDE